MNNLKTELGGTGEGQPSTRNATIDHSQRTTRALAFGAAAYGAFALGATAIGALAIGGIAVGAFVMKRGHVRSLTVDVLEVRRLHVGELAVDHSVPR